MNSFEIASDRSIATAIKDITPSSHVCSICQSGEGWIENAALFLQQGLERGEKCVYVGGEDAHGQMIARLAEHGVDVLQITDSGSLSLVTPNEAGLKGDHTDPYRMFLFWKKASAQAMQERSRGLRGASEGRWFHPEAITLEQLQAYEEGINELAQETGCTLLCHYARDYLPSPFLLQALRAHPLVIYQAELCRNIYSMAGDEITAKFSDDLAVEILLHGLRNYEQSAQELDGTRAELDRVARILILGELTASVAHEVTQPVASILADGSAALRWLANTPPHIEEARLSLTRIVAGGRRAENIIQRIRSLVKRADSRKELFSVNEVIAEVIDLTRHQLRESHISIRAELATLLPAVWAHRLQIQQVVLNLVINALEAIDAQPGGRREICIRTQREGRYVKVSVIDSGIGIRTDQMQYVLKPFYTTKSHGMGIGLSISSRIIEAHEGQLWAERNQASSGAAFHFMLLASDQ